MVANLVTALLVKFQEPRGVVTTGNATRGTEEPGNLVASREVPS